MVARKSSHRSKGDDDHSRIRALFLDRRATYSATAAMHVSGLERDDLLDRIETGEINATQRVSQSIPWDDLVRVLIERVPLATIYEALGDRADEVLPPLLRLERLDVAVPAYIIRVFEWAAKSADLTLEHYLHGELFDLVEELWRDDRAIDALPGVAEALFFPDPPPPRWRDRNR